MLSYALPYFWLAAIMLAPFAYGLNAPSTWQPLALVSCALALFLFKKNTLSFAPTTRMGLTLAAIVLTYTCLQALFPAPAFTTAALIWQDVAATLNLPVQGTLSLTPPITRQETAKWALYLLTFLAVFHYRKSNAFRAYFFPTFLVLAAIMTLYGLTFPSTILGQEKAMYLGQTTGTFLNKNTYAAYAGAALLTSGFLLKNSLKNMAHHKIYTALLVASGLLQTLGLVTSGSRAGITCTLGAALILTALVTKRYKLCLLPFALSPGALLLPASLTQPFLQDIALRLNLYTSTLTGITEHPFFGTGLGSFSHIFPTYRTDAMPLIINSRVTQAHNTTLETALEIGLPATLLLALAITLLLLPLFKRVQHPKNTHSTAPLSLSILALFALHSSVDFTLEIPAITLFAIALLARHQRSASTSPTQPLHLSQNPTFTHALPLIGVLVSAWSVIMPAATRPDAQSSKRSQKHYLTTMPTSPYTWAHLAAQNPEKTPQYLQKSQQFGPNETRLLFFRIDALTPLFHTLTPQQKTLFLKDIQQAHTHAPSRIQRRPLAAYLLSSNLKNQ